jgi:hypothetical protein
VIARCHSTQSLSGIEESRWQRGQHCTVQKIQTGSYSMSVALNNLLKDYYVEVNAKSALTLSARTFKFISEDSTFIINARRKEDLSFFIDVFSGNAD